jgi:hypothetical protein
MRWGKVRSVVTIVAMLWFSVVSPVMAATGAFCTTGSNPTVNTALGCVPVRVGPFVTWLLPKLFGVAGGISFLLMIYGFFLMTVSSGDPKAVQGAWETITSAISGLLVSIFALFLLRLIAVNILQIPGIN